MPKNEVDDVLAEFEQVVARLVRLYQFRDRDEAYRYGLSVSQAYMISILGRAKTSLSMGDLASVLRLDVSTATRAVDGLVSRELLRREVDKADRRVVRIGLTSTGKRMSRRIERQWLGIMRNTLEGTPVASRRTVVKTLQRLVDEISQTRSAGDDGE